MDVPDRSGEIRRRGERPFVDRERIDWMDSPFGEGENRHVEVPRRSMRPSQISSTNQIAGREIHWRVIRPVGPGTQEISG